MVVIYLDNGFGSCKIEIIKYTLTNSDAIHSPFIQDVF
jgi:hypothetical protein